MNPEKGEFLCLHRYLMALVTLPEEEWKRGRGLFLSRVLEGGETFYHEGDAYLEVAFVRRGILKAHHTNRDGKECVGHFFIENEFYIPFQAKGAGVSFGITSVESTEILVAPYQKWLELYAQHPIWERIGRMMAERSYLNKLRREEQFLQKSAEERYQEFMNESPQLISRIPQYLIASYLGLAPQSLCRLLKRVRSHPGQAH